MAQAPNIPEKFNLKIVQDKLQAALVEEDDVHLRLYFESCEELKKCLTLMGKVFYFIIKDLTKKMEHLDNYLTEFVIAHLYRTVKTMITHEKKYDLVTSKEYVSGCLALIRIHNELEFVWLFLKKLEKLQDHETISGICREAYNEALSQHHSYITRSLTTAAMGFLPTRKQFLKQICGDEEDIQKTLKTLPDALAVNQIVHLRIKNLYTLHNLHDLE